MIRARHDGDFPALAEIVRLVHAAEGYPVNLPDNPSDWLIGDHQAGAWVAVLDDAIFGQVSLSRPPHESGGTDELMLERLFVHPRAIGHGIGRALISFAVDEAARIGLPLSLEVADNCHAAIRLYQRLGWVETGSEPIDWGGALATRVIQFRPSTPAGVNHV